MQTFKITALFWLFFTSSVFAQTDHEQITQTIQKFIVGTTYNYPDSINAAFFPDTRMFLYNGTDSAFYMTSEQYASLYDKRVPGTYNNRINKIVDIHIVEDVAFAQLQIDIPYFGNRNNDLLLLKKILGEWKIVSKCTSAAPLPKSPAEMVANPAKEAVVEGLKRPWSIAFLSAEEAIIAEKDGSIVKVNLQSGLKSGISGLPKDVAGPIKIDTVKHPNGVFPAHAQGQMHRFNAGWFQVLLDPDFQRNSYLYISYAAENEAKESALKVVRGKLTGNKLNNLETLCVAGPYSHGLFHYGGGMAFGKDEKLYIATGERNFYEHLNPPLPTAQDLTDKRGKIIRINPDGTLPADNPDFGKNAAPGLFALGIRATQGIILHPSTGDLWFTDHGSFQGDELNILEKGANYGWPYKTSGGYRTSDYTPQVPENIVFKDPVHFWEHTIAPTGLTFYNGREFPLWEGEVIVPGLSKGNLWHLKLENKKVVAAEELFINDRVRLRKAVVSPDNQLYLLTDEENGRLLRVINKAVKN
ncbi:hypothetical protein C9994_04930 [Marivirga lumbricoides]|uniref:Glucose/Sorbosone dehydrogenase domain-containing protein n=1 Tax=Marivirga lumbricoides TaxID=1046115 RepID=A0A2T4DT77_9BACT|nr:hypothetical protein C9994_04930 [Marivirga lumbricoides]